MIKFKKSEPIKKESYPYYQEGMERLKKQKRFLEKNMVSLDDLPLIACKKQFNLGELRALWMQERQCKK